MNKRSNQWRQARARHCLTQWGAAVLFLAMLPPICAAPDMAMKPVHLSGKVLTPDGKPAVDATVTFDQVENKNQSDRIIVTQTAKSDANGVFDLTAAFTAARDTYPVLYVTSPAGIAICPIHYNRNKPQLVTLMPFTSVRVHLLDSKGQPLAHVSLTPQYFMLDRNFANWGRSVVSQWNCETDATGTAIFSGLPQGYEMALSVKDDRYAQPDWKSQVKLAKQAVTADQTIHLVRGGTITGTILYGPTQKPAAGIGVQATENGNGGTSGWAMTDQNGQYSIPRLPAGSYTLMLDQHGPVDDWTAAAHSAALTEGGQVSGTDFSLVHGALLTGTVTDKITGKPLAGVQIYVNGPAGDRTWAESGPDGSFRLRVPAGKQSVSAYSPGSNEGVLPQAVTVAEGETKILTFQATAPLIPQPVYGIVLGSDNKPVANAEVLATAVQQQEQKTVTDDGGRFVFDEPGLTTKSRLYARSGDLGTLTGSTVPSGSADVTLHLAAGAFCAISGQVKDVDAKPVIKANLALIRWQDGIGSDVDTTQTDSQGCYSFRSAYGDAQYSVRVDAPGYAQHYSTTLAAAAGKPLIIPPLALIHADSFVAGIVVDPQGKPVAGADVSDNDTGDTHVTTDSRGHFRINGVARGKTVIQVRAAEDRYASIQIASGQESSVIKVQSLAEAEEEGRRLGAKMKADPTNHGNGDNAQVLLKVAEARAAASGKKVFLVFHASWCGPCFLLHRFLEDPRVKPVMDAHFVVQDVDIWEHGKNNWENPGGTDIYKKYGGPNSVPFFVVLDNTGTKRGDAIHNGDNMGMPSEPEDIQFFLRMLKAAAPNMTVAEVETLKSGLQRDSTF